MRSSKVPLVGTFLVLLSFALAACSPATPTAVIPVTGRTAAPAVGMTPTPVAAAPGSSSSSGGSSSNIKSEFIFITAPVSKNNLFIFYLYIFKINLITFMR